MYRADLNLAMLRKAASKPKAPLGIDLNGIGSGFTALFLVRGLGDASGWDA